MVKRVERMRDHVFLVAPPVVESGAGDHLEQLVDVEVLEDLLGEGLGLGGGHSQTGALREQREQYGEDAVDQRVLEHADFREAIAIRRDRVFDAVMGNAHLGESLDEGWADEDS